MSSKDPKSVNYKLKWILRNVTLENIKKHDETNALKTQVFQTRLDKCLIEWDLELYYDEEEKSVSFNFYKRKAEDRFLLNLSVSMQNYELLKHDNTLYEKNLPLNWPCLIKLDELLDPTKVYIDDEGCLTLDIEVAFTEVLKVDKRVSPSTPTDLYSKFYNSKTLSDFTFKCSDDVEFPVHQVILAANSEVFLKMFTTDMKEKKSNAAELTDISSETMKRVMKFIYTKDIRFSDAESTIQILDFTEKYQLLELKQRCIDELMKKLNKENVLDIFKAGDLYDDLLKRKCLSFIIKNYEDIKSTSKYDMLEKPLMKKIIDEFYRLLGSTQILSFESSL